MKERVAAFVSRLDWANLILGAVIGLLLSSFASPALNPHATRLYEQQGWYSAPPVNVNIENTGEFHPVNSTVEDFEGLRWQSDYSVYRVQIQNTGEKAVDQLKFTWRAPGCIVYSNTDGPTAGGHYSLNNRGTYGIFSNQSLAINRYQCTKVIEVVEGELKPDESLAVEFVVTNEFEKCDVLIDANPLNRHLLEYTWEKNGVRFAEEDLIHPDHLEATYQEVQSTQFVGTRESLTLSSGKHIHSFVVGVRGETLEEAVSKCGNASV